jgi:uncharacterized protein DUF1203
MAYRIEGLSPEAFESLFSMLDGELATRNAVRVTADEAGGYPCRVSLRDAAPGDELVLVNHVSHDVPTPFRTAYAIYVRKGAEAAAFEDEAPAYLDKRTLGLRGFDEAGMLKGALLAMPGEADARIRELFGRPEVAIIHAHNAAYGCFLARIERN